MPEIAAVRSPSSPGRRRALVGGALVATAMLVFAACGSSSDDSVSTKPTTSVSAAAPTGAPAAVKPASNAKFGRILVDSNGNTLYTLTDANGKAVACTGQCLAFWPPAIAAAGASTDMTGVSTVINNGKQVTYLGLPLYTYAQDSGPGSATGDGLNSFGGTWHVVVLGGSKASTGDSSTTTTTKSAGRYGY